MSTFWSIFLTESLSFPFPCKCKTIFIYTFDVACWTREQLHKCIQSNFVCGDEIMVRISVLWKLLSGPIEYVHKCPQVLHSIVSATSTVPLLFIHVKMYTLSLYCAVLLMKGRSRIDFIAGYYFRKMIKQLNYGIHLSPPGFIFPPHALLL